MQTRDENYVCLSVKRVHCDKTNVLSRMTSQLSQLIVQILDTALLSPLGGLGTTYDVHYGLIGKRVVDFLLVLTFFR